MNLITPEYITNYISFKYGDTEWNYDAFAKKDIPKLQAEGSAKLWNILQQKDVALLADEVGMGKTYQALAIIITLWLQKPNAKILLYAPNETVASQWINEYETFIRYHYKYNDDFIKSSINGQPLRQAIYCENQLELLKYVNQEWPSLYICKTSSLSNFLSKKITQEELDNLNIKIIKNVDEKSSDEEKAKWMYRFAKKCNDFIYKRLAIGENRPFDLIVFDEAHYLRNAQANTNRSLVAHAFFAKRNVRNYKGQKDPMAFLSQKALLLTATPNHSSSKNIESIVSIFNNHFKGEAPAKILDQICVRRFRRLHNKTKHQYRKELDEPVKMTSIKEKLFFAMYQRALVKHKAEQFKKNKDTLKSQNPYKLLYGYLEGFEFLPNRRSETLEKSTIQNKSSDFEERDDKRVIMDLADAHFSVYKKFPLHPKYLKTVESLSSLDSNSLDPDKKVVFVRRIPSILELSRRAIEIYDQRFESILIETKAFDNSIFKNNQNNDSFRMHFSKDFAATNEDNDDPVNENDNQQNKELATPINKKFPIPESKYYSLFTIKKEGKYKTTDCSNFRNRFLKEFQLFSVFTQPGSDYLGANYTFNGYKYQDGKRNYAITARKLRFDGLSRKKQDYLSSYISFPSDIVEKSASSQIYPTLFTIWVNTVLESNNELLQEALSNYKKFSEIEKEAFTNYITKGLLFSSSFLIVFYAHFKAINKKQKSKPDEYFEFCEAVKKDMLQKGLAFLIAKAVSSFQIFYKKELNLTEENLLREKWTFLNNTLPVYPVCAENNRSNILKAFNTPFYPNVLVATSILQEGVNLHYHCNEVIHYGLAWTQGDNEQRVGRVDRLNGKMENQLRKSDTAILPIHYPYLKNTIDQDQTARFILRKKEAEKLIDQFITIEQSNEINYSERMDDSIWKNSFNNPAVAAYENKDPFPVLYQNDFKNIQPAALQAQNSISRKTILEPVLSALAKHFKKEFYIYDNNPQAADNKVFAIKHIRANERHQPVIAEFNYYEPGLHILRRPVYYLRIKTPIYRRGYKYNDDLRRFGKQLELYNNNPVLKICFDNNRKDEFKYFVCADLPIFEVNIKELNVSTQEVIEVVNDLITFADELEKKYTDNKDILNEDIIEDNLPRWRKQTSDLSSNRGNSSDHNWKSINLYLFKEKIFDEKLNPFNHLYYLNFNEPFVKYYRKYGADYRCVGFYKNDALNEETNLYNFVYENENI